MKYNYNYKNVKWGKECRYCDLCDMLQIPRKTGHSKIAQIKDIKRVMKLDDSKKGKYIPIELYEVEKTQLATGLFKEDIEILLLDLLARNDERHISLTIKHLMRELEMVNDNYIKGYEFEKIYLSLEELTKADSDTIGDVYYLINDKCSRKIREALKDLVDKALILWEIRMMIYVKEYVYKLSKSGRIIYDENDEPIIEKEVFINRFPTIEEREIILSIERKAMKEMKVKNKKFFNICKEAREKFKARCKQLLEETNIQYYYYVYDIVYNSEEILEELKRTELTSVRNRLNSNVLNQMIKTIETRKQNTEDKLKDKFGEAYSVIDLYEDKLSNFEKIVNDENYENKASKVAKKIIDRNIRSRDKIK